MRACRLSACHRGKPAGESPQGKVCTGKAVGENPQGKIHKRKFVRHAKTVENVPELAEKYKRSEDNVYMCKLYHSCMPGFRA